MFFAGLRPGEARGARWEDFEGKRIFVRQSVWHTFTTDPKTLDAASPVPVMARMVFIAPRSYNSCRIYARWDGFKGLVAHTNLATTIRHYVKDVPENTLLAMKLLEKLCNECATVDTVRPN
jgi:integrase